jgi:alkylation response protein AidB-like acyl-CoA dehydrogenase
MDAGDRELFERSVVQAVAAAVPSELGADLNRALHDLGWLDALADDDHAAVSTLFEQLGRRHASCAAIDHLLARALSDGTSAGADGGVVLPALGGTTPPGLLDRDHLGVAGLATTRILDQGSALVPTSVAAGPPGNVGAVVGVTLPTADLTLRPVTGLDPDLGLVEVTADLSGVDAALAPSLAWESGLALAQMAVGHELIGASRTMLELARVHALERVQFGRPIAGFQAVRHRLADTLVAIESADALLSGAWEDRSPATAAMAKATAGRAARTTARHCQQVLAGIGFTTEHDLHRYVRRVLALDELFGSSRGLTAAVGSDILATRRLPPLLPL